MKSPKISKNYFAVRERDGSYSIRYTIGSSGGNSYVEKMGVRGCNVQRTIHALCARDWELNRIQRRYTGVHVRELTRLPSSAFGNPRFRFTFEDPDTGEIFEAATAPDSSLAYEATNYRDGDRVNVTIETFRGVETLRRIHPCR